MSEMGLIAPPKEVAVTFALEPAYNVLTSLILLNADLSGRSEWVERIAAALSPQQLETNQRVCGSAMAHLNGKAWFSFPAWVGDLATRDPIAMRDRELDLLLSKASDVLGKEESDLPNCAELLANRAAYLSLMECLCEHKGSACEPAFYEAEHEMLQDPAARRALIVTHLRTMWDEYVADEWERNLPMLQESIAAFESLDYAGRSATEIICQVTDRDLPREWESWQEEVGELIFIPSAHIGPYLLLADRSNATARIVFGARVPQGATVRSPALSRSELVTRLSALADDTRLRILEWVAHRGEQRAQDIIASLDLSQSAASRHLRHLSATGYLVERRCEGAKCYRLNCERLKSTLEALERFLQ